MCLPWLIGPYIEAYLKVFGKSGLSLADRIMIELEDQMQNDCIGTCRVLRFQSPFYAHGGFSFAMSVSETLRAKKAHQVIRMTPILRTTE